MATTATTLPLVVRAMASDIKLAHSVFALPFALLGAFLAGTYSGAVGVINWRQFGGQLVLIVLAMVFARTTAMLANRLLDRRLDKLNPRTAGRAIPSGRLTAGQVRAGIMLSSAGFMAVCAAFGTMWGNWWPTILGIPVLVWLCAYPMLKRFSALCHLYLGASLAISPIAAAIAVDPSSVGRQPSLWLLGAMVMCWVAGFDVIYALQDVEIDRESNLHSLPSSLGESRAMWISRLLHVMAFGFLLGAWAIDERLGVFWGAGTTVVGLLLIVEHATVARWGTTKMALVFFTINGIISCLLGLLGIIDIIAA